MARRAFGYQRRMTPAQKARNVGEAIHRRAQEGRAWQWADFGLTENSPQTALVRQWLIHNPAEKAV